MRTIFLLPYVNAQSLIAALRDETQGEDVVEYALFAALIALAAAFGMSTTLANAINVVSSTLSGLLLSYI